MNDLITLTLLKAQKFDYWSVLIYFYYYFYAYLVYFSYIYVTNTVFDCAVGLKGRCKQINSPLIIFKINIVNNEVYTGFVLLSFRFNI